MCVITKKGFEVKKLCPVKKTSYIEANSNVVFQTIP